MAAVQAACIQGCQIRPEKRRVYKGERKEMGKRIQYILGAWLLVILMAVGCAPAAKRVSETSRAEQVSAVQTEVASEIADSDAAEAEVTEAEVTEAAVTEADAFDEFGSYTSKEEVALYLYLYGHLPENFITKNEAKALGWVSKEGNLGQVAPGKSIGGDRFGNREGNLPEKKGRIYYECDIDSDGGYRGGKRIVYSSDGLIYYTEDHYETFELLYGEE